MFRYLNLIILVLFYLFTEDVLTATEINTSLQDTDSDFTPEFINRVISQAAVTLRNISNNPTAYNTLLHIWNEVKTILKDDVGSQTLQMMSNLRRQTLTDEDMQEIIIKISQTISTIMSKDKGYKVAITIVKKIIDAVDLTSGMESLNYITHGIKQIKENRKYAPVLRAVKETCNISTGNNVAASQHDKLSQMKTIFGLITNKY